MKNAIKKNYISLKLTQKLHMGLPKQKNLIL